ncbi:MAG: hypothetical protein OCC49_17615 [Fibrobacterales bacterium]
MKKENFLKTIDTLKLYHRSELLNDQGDKIINDLYVDPLPENHTMNTLLKPNTTFLIGRKGTGKSTIFQRVQHELNSDKNKTWAYIDIKTLYESSTSEMVGSLPEELSNALSTDAIQRLSVFKSFMIEMLNEIKSQISARISSSLWNQFKEAFTGSAAELFEQLDEFLEELKEDKYLDATGSIQAQRSEEETSKETEKTSTEVTATASNNPSLQAKFIAELIQELEKKKSQNYSQVYIKIFNVRNLILRIREILDQLNLRHLYIFIDDFSELPKNDMEQVVDTIIAPLNNWSDDFIKFKIAIYPGRLYSGQIDMSKIDEVYLDIYRAYGRNDLTNMESRAVDFTKRLVESRIAYFCDQDVSEYFDSSNENFWRVLFYACIGNPRILGYILYYCYESSIIYDSKISIKTVQAASRRYFDEKISYYFKLNKFLHETFEERSSIYSLKELLEAIVKRSKELRTYKDSKVTKDIPGRTPTSHFHIGSDYSSIMSTLELNFFITKYYEMKDRDGREVSVYSLNYGLCQQETLNFGRPTETREQRLYFVERIFDYTPIVLSYIKINQEIVCDNCKMKHANELLPMLQAYDMLCPECKTGTCRVVNLSRKYENLIQSIDDENLLPGTELGILKTLHDERKEMFAKDIAAELDCSYQLIGKRGRILSDRGLVDRDSRISGRRVFQLEEMAENMYFQRDGSDDLNFEES